MEELGLFPLDIALVPRERVPLHIFEQRYRELISECLEHSSEFGFILQQGGELRQVGTRARVDEVLARFEDGRLTIVVEGTSRFRRLTPTSGRSFITAAVEDVADEDDPPSPEEVAACTAAFVQVAALAGAEAPEILELSDAIGGISFGIAGRLGVPAALKQELLEMRSERQRVIRLTDELNGPIATAVAAQEIGRRASTNGRVERH
jgi:Lon protease-like protein